MFTLPLFIFVWIGLSHFSRLRLWILIGIAALHCTLFLFLIFDPPQNPGTSPQLNHLKQQELQAHLKALQITPLFTPPILLNWEAELQTLNSYAQLNLVLRYQQYQWQHKRLQTYEKEYEVQAKQRGQQQIVFPTLWNLTYQQKKKRKKSSYKSSANLNLAISNPNGS